MLLTNSATAKNPHWHGHPIGDDPYLATWHSHAHSGYHWHASPHTLLAIYPTKPNPETTAPEQPPEPQMNVVTMSEPKGG